MEHPDLNLLIQREIRLDRERSASQQRLIPTGQQTNPIRRLTGSMLISLGHRIADTPRPIVQLPTMGELSIAGRTDR